MSIETVMQIASQLAAEGKQPSVALIKARLPAPCPMPVVIQALQRWRSQQGGTAVEQTTVPAVATSPASPWVDDWAAAREPLQQLFLQQQAEIKALREEVAALRRALQP